MDEIAERVRRMRRSCCRARSRSGEQVRPARRAASVVEIDDRAGRVGRAVDAVGARRCASARRVRISASGCASGEREFLIASALARARHVNRRLAARDHAQRTRPLVALRPATRCEVRRGRRRAPRRRPASSDAHDVVAEARGLRGRAGHRVAPRLPMTSRVARDRRGSPGFGVSAHRRRGARVEPRDDGRRIGRRAAEPVARTSSASANVAGIGDRRSGCDDAQIVADDVGDGERAARARGARPRAGRP